MKLPIGIGILSLMLLTAACGGGGGVSTTPTARGTPAAPGGEVEEAVQHLASGVELAELSRWEEAIAEFDQAIELDPSLAEVYGNRALAYYELGQFDRTIADLDKAIQLDPNLAMAYASQDAYRLRDFDAAIADFDKIIERNPNLAEAYNYRGRAYAERGQAYADLGDFGRAITDLEKAIELDTSLADVVNANLASAYYERAGARTEQQIILTCDRQLIADLEKAIELDPDLSGAYAGLASAYYNCGRDYAQLGAGSLEQAKADFEKVIEFDPELTDPDLSDLYKWWETAYARSMDVGQIIADMDNIIGLDPDDAVAYAVRARYPFLVGVQQAIADLEKAIALTTHPGRRAELEERLAELRGQ